MCERVSVRPCWTAFGLLCRCCSRPCFAFYKCVFLFYRIKKGHRSHRHHPLFDTLVEHFIASHTPGFACSAVPLWWLFELFFVRYSNMFLICMSDAACVCSHESNKIHAHTPTGKQYEQQNICRLPQSLSHFRCLFIARPTHSTQDEL